jgi:hypothetical protein
MSEHACAIREVRGQFELDGSRLTFGGDQYELVKVPGEGDCAFDSMAFILHSVMNGNVWTCPEDAYTSTGIGTANELRMALDQYREGIPRDEGWGDQIDWVVFSAMFGVTVHVISYGVSSTGVCDEKHSVISPSAYGRKVYVPGYVRARDGDGLHAYVCNHYCVHYDPMRLVRRC